MTPPIGQPGAMLTTPYVPHLRGARAWLALLALLVAGGYLLLADSTVLPDFGGDNAAYWLTAKAWSPWQQPTDVEVAFARASTYPPLYPLLLAWLGGGASLPAAHTVTIGMLLAAFAALAWFARAAGLDGLAATGVTLAFAASSIARVEGLDLHSEPLFMACMLLALGHGARLQAGGNGRDALLLGCWIAAALLTRSAGMTLLAAAGLMALRERRSAWVLAILPGALAVAANAWLQHSQQRYAGEFLAHYSASAALDVLWTNLRVLPFSWSSAIGGASSGLWQVCLLALFGLTALAAAGWRAWQGHFDGTVALVYLATVVAWPYPAELPRLLLPLVALSSVEICLAARRIWDCRRTLAWRQLWWFPLLFALPDSAIFAARCLADVPAPLAPYRKTTHWHQPDAQRAFVEIGFQQAADEAFRAIRAEVPAEACVLAIKPSVVTAFTGRASQRPPPAELDAAAFERGLAATGCRHLLLFALVSPSYPQPFYPLDRLQGRLRALAQFPNTTTPGQTAMVLAEILPPP